MALNSVVVESLPSPPWEVYFTPPDGILVLLVSESEWWRGVSCRGDKASSYVVTEVPNYG